MPLLTVFSAPKPFTDPHIDTIQRNALQSWLRLGPQVEVLLVGDEPGMAEVAREYGVRQLPEVARNQAGTPLVSSIFDLARRASAAPLMAYVNADILLLPEVVRAAERTAAQLEDFLLVGQRWDLDVRRLLPFPADWAEALRSETARRGRLHAPSGSDYFIFPRALFADIPEFAIGRAGWDNWMIYYARRQGWTVVDATPSVMIVHQDHDYRHLPGGRPHYDQQESRRNEKLAGGWSNLYMVLDSDRQLVNGQIRRPQFSLLRALRRAEVLLTPADGRRQGPRYGLARQFRRLRRWISGTL